MGKFLSENGIKIIFVVKIMVLAFIVFSEGGIITIGEKFTQAQDNESSAKDIKDAEFLDKSDESGTRPKSFMEDLLTLPKIKPQENRKDELAKYFSIIERKSRQVDDRIKILKERQKQLQQLEASISEKLEKLEEEITYFQQTQQKEKEIKDERLNALVLFYQKMTPKKAAPVFEKLDKDLVVALFNKIPQKQTMQILSLMNPDKSVELSEYFGRIKSAKEYDLLKEINSALLKEFEQCKTEPTKAN